jgi:hypothetical protein
MMRRGVEGRRLGGFGARELWRRIRRGESGRCHGSPDLATMVVVPRILNQACA